MINRSIKLFSLTVIFIGFSSVFAQSLLIREMLVVLYGNEIAVGIILSFWLFWTGAGSFLGARLLKRTPSRLLFYSAYIIFSAAVILELILVRNVRIIFHFEPGELISPFAMFVISALTLSPFAIVNGLLFYLCIQIASGKLGNGGVSFVYSLDAFGDMLGGIVFSFLFVFLFSPLKNLYIIMMLNILFIAGIFLFEKISIKTKAGISAIILPFLILGFMLKPIEKGLIKREWHGFDVLGVKSSLYGDLLITKHENTYSLYENGILAFTFPFKMDSEESVHFPLLESGSVKRVLVIGSGVRGLLSEVLKYPVCEVDYLELDPVLISFVEQYLPQSDRKALSDPRVKVFNVEARVFLNHYKGDKFDAVLLNTPAPYTAYLNRFYTYEFFERIKDILSGGGVLSFTLPSKEDYLTRDMRDFDASIYHTLIKVFPNIMLIPGNKLRFIASSSSEFLTYNVDILSRRMVKYGLKTKFINKYYFKMKFLPWHIDYVRRVLNSTTAVRLNYDFKPISYYYGMKLFFSRFRSHLRNLLNMFTKINVSVYFIVIFLFIFLIFIIGKNRMLGACVFSMGALGMSSVVLSVLGYQIVFGYVYHKIGLISAVFMLGVSLGASWLYRKVKHPHIRMLVYSLLLSGVYMVCIPYIFRVLKYTFSAMEIVSLFLPFFMGLIVGFIFPLANRLYNKDKGLSVSAAGLFYFYDLIGGAAAGVALSLMFIPLYGIFMSAGIISFMAFVCSGFLLLDYYRR